MAPRSSLRPQSSDRAQEVVLILSRPSAMQMPIPSTTASRSRGIELAETNEGSEDEAPFRRVRRSIGRRPRRMSLRATLDDHTTFQALRGSAQLRSSQRLMHIPNGCSGYTCTATEGSTLSGFYSTFQTRIWVVPLKTTVEARSLRRNDRLALRTVSTQPGPEHRSPQSSLSRTMGGS